MSEMLSKCAYCPQNGGCYAYMMLINKPSDVEWSEEQIEDAKRKTCPEKEKEE